MNNPFTNAGTPPFQTRFRNRYGLHILLFLLTLCTTTLAGTELVSARLDLLNFEGLENMWIGLPYSLSFLGFLTCHEFGHYFMSMYHRVKCSLPYFIPIYIPFMAFNIGSMGAVIRMREAPPTATKYFDIGIAGPLAGFVVALGLLWYGFAFLPEVSYLHQIHPEYKEWFGDKMPSDPELQNALSATGAISIELGNSLIFQLFKYLFADPAKLPGAMELYHYPFLFVGYLTLFFTALNLLPIGQLDGGHVTYGLFGREIAGKISRITVFLLVAYGGIGMLEYDEADYMSLVYMGLYILFVFYVMTKIVGEEKVMLALALCCALIGLQFVIQTYTPLTSGGTLWLFYSLIAVRVIRLDHPPAYEEDALDEKRRILGIIALVIFILCFTPDPLKLVVLEPNPAHGVVATAFMP